jgi:Tol biopolymer transport system component
VKPEFGLWRMDASAGERPVQLVSGDVLLPIVTPDDGNVIFVSNRKDTQSLWIVPIAGGKATEILPAFVAGGSVDISRDGRRLVFLTSAAARNQFTLTVCDLPACTNRLSLTPPANFGYGATRFTPDGRGIAYVDLGLANIWSQPLQGGQPRQITHFDNRRIAAFAWSRDGKQLAVIRTITTNDIVLLKGLKK